MPLGWAAIPLRSDRAALLFLVLVWIVMSALTLPVGDFPLSDDWVHALGVRALLQSGRFALPARSGPDIVAQVYWGALFCLPTGFSFTALRLSTVVLGLVGVLSLFALMREAGASRRLAALAALSLVH